MKRPRSSAARSRRAGRRSHIRGPSSEVTHASLDELLRSFSPGNGLGDNSQVRQSSSTRVVFQNVNGVPKLATDQKQSQVNLWLRNERVGIALLAETNRRWPSLAEGQSWNDRIRSACKTGFYATSTFNRQRSYRRSRTSFQYGGSTATLLNEVSHSAKESGQDATGLGRWAYIRIRGKK